MHAGRSGCDGPAMSPSQGERPRLCVAGNVTETGQYGRGWVMVIGDWLHVYGAPGVWPENRPARDKEDGTAWDGRSLLLAHRPPTRGTRAGSTRASAGAPPGPPPSAATGSTVATASPRAAVGPMQRRRARDQSRALPSIHPSAPTGRLRAWGWPGKRHGPGGCADQRLVGRGATALGRAAGGAVPGHPASETLGDRP